MLTLVPTIAGMQLGPEESLGMHSKPAIVAIAAISIRVTKVVNPIRMEARQPTSKELLTPSNSSSNLQEEQVNSQVHKIITTTKRNQPRIRLLKRRSWGMFQNIINWYRQPRIMA